MEVSQDLEAPSWGLFCVGAADTGQLSGTTAKQRNGLRSRIGGQVWYEEEWEPLSKEVASCPGWSTCFRLPLR